MATATKPADTANTSVDAIVRSAVETCTDIKQPYVVTANGLIDLVGCLDTYASTARAIGNRHAAGELPAKEAIELLGKVLDHAEQLRAPDPAQKVGRAAGAANASHDMEARGHASTA